MIGKKKKLSKKEIQEDKLVVWFYKAQDYILKNQQYLLIGVGAIAILVLAILWYNNKISDDNQLASLQLSKAIPFYEKAQYQKAIDGEPGTDINGLASIVENYGSTEQGEIAKIYLGNSYLALGNYKKALEVYSDYSGDSKIHMATSLAGQAACYENLGNYEKAAENYNKAAKISILDSQTAEYLLDSAKNYLKNNSLEKAKELISEIKEDYKTTTAAREADRYTYKF